MKMFRSLQLILAVILFLIIPGAAAASEWGPDAADPNADEVQYWGDSSQNRLEADMTDVPTASCSTLPQLNAPTLLAPANASTLNTIAPLYQWDVGADMNVTGMVLQLEVSVDPNFISGGGVYLWRYLPSQTSIESWRDPDNLDAGRTFYMRAKLLCREDSREGPYTDTWWFVSGWGGTLPSAPQVVSPADGALVLPGGPTMSWTNVPGAIDYRPEWHKLGASGGSWNWVTDPQYQETHLALGTTYEWHVAARNEYGIGAESLTRSFTVGQTKAQIEPGGGALAYIDVQGSPTSFRFPSGAVDQSTGITLTLTTPATNPTGFSWAGHAFILEAGQGGQAAPGLVFGAPVPVTINYTDADLAGMPEDSLKLIYWNETQAQWEDAACGPYDRRPAENRLTVPICHLSLFSLFGAGPAPLFCNAVTVIPKAECEAMVALYNSTNGPGWINKTGWLITKTPCSWYGAYCSGGHLLSSSLSGNQLAGPIPPGLGDLTSLQRLYLGNNRLTGSIPTELGNLTSLQVLNLSGNQLDGSIPAMLGNLVNVQYLTLASNQLTGTIPARLGNLTGLLSLDLSYNQLTGTIPAELGNLASLLRLSLTGNQLTGAIPPQLGNLANLHSLDLDDNQLTGPIPPELGKLSNLGTTSITGSRLDGPVSQEAEGLALQGGGGRVSGLWLGSNQLTGAIPPELGNLANLEYMSLDNNQLTDPIPPKLGDLTKLKSLYLSGNHLTGAIPPELGGLTALSSLMLDHNPLSGPLPLALTTLSLNLFWYDATDLCEPGDSAFQTWLGGITYLHRTDLLCGTRTLSGTVWNDLNRNGGQDAGEPPLSGVTVTLTRDAGTLASIAAGRQVVTGSDGGYRFANVAASSYLVAVVPSDIWPTVPSPVSVVVPEDSDVTVPPIGLTRELGRVFLPLVLR